MEQGFLFILISNYPEHTTKIIAGFIIVFITTISFEKICMESRYTELNQKIMTLIMEYNKINEEINNLRKNLEQKTK